MWSRLVTPVIHVPPDDTESSYAHQLKQLFLGINILGTLALIFLALFFAWFQAYRAGLIYGTYAIVSAAIYVWLRVTGRGYRGFLYVQIVSVQIVPALSTLVLGGVAESGYLFMWALLGPLAAIVFTPLHRIWRWFALYLVLLIAVFIAPPLSSSHTVPSTFLLMLSLVNFGGASLLITLMLYYAAKQLRMEQEKSEELLLNILPKEIAAILKNENGIIADYFPGVSVLFADIADFTPMSATMSPVELVELLNDVFSHLDSLVDAYGLEKIKTIGDCYMVAAGVPRPRADHAHVLVSLALDIQEFAHRYEFAGGRRITFRIGINSGSVVAGVIGRKKFIYDLWGDAVNVASRMESHGRNGAIQITDETYRLIEDEFVCESQGTIQVKGKGEMPVWHVVGARQSSLQ